jgi:death-on-curing protein
MNYLDLAEVLAIHAEMIRLFGGTPAILDIGKVQSAVAQPQMTFGGQDLYPTIVEKAAALAFSLTTNHGFQDGNKRTGYAAMTVFLKTNGYEVVATVDEREATFLALADHRLTRDEFTDWLTRHVVPRS